MSSWNSPAVARRWLAYELRRLREDRGLNQKDVGKACGWSGVRVSYLEKWDHPQRIFDRDLDKLLPLYEVPEDDRPDFYAAAREAREKGWWERYGEGVVPAFLSGFIGLEQGASLVNTFEPTIVPGLLQTREYMEAVIRADTQPRTDRLIRQIVEVRTTRQEVLSRGDGPAELVVVVDESVLRRVVGGPSTMADQMAHVAAMCERPNVRLHVFPFESGMIRGVVPSAYRILHFPRSTPPIVYLETGGAATWIEDAPGVEQHDLAFLEIARGCLSGDDSVEMVRDAAAGYAARR